MTSSTRRPFVLLGLGAVLLALATLVVPVWVMRPFRPQGPTELAVALWVLRFGPWLLAGAALLAIAAVVRAWPAGWRRRSAAVAMLLITIGAGALSRVNVFERMFAPLPAPRFAATGESGLPADAIVMALRVGPTSRAYPVEVMAYHHVLNDVVGDTPLVVTY